MSPRFSFSKNFPLLFLVLLTVMFCFFVITYEKNTAYKAERQLTKHAQIISDDLWNFNLEGATEYLRLAAEADNYLSLEVRNQNGESFKKVDISEISDLEGLLIKAGLAPIVKQSAPVKIDRRHLGWIEAVWIPKTYFLEAYVFLFFLLLHFIVVLYIRLHNSNLKLEERVEERTRELRTTNIKMEQEYLARIKAQQEQEKLRARLEQSRKMESLGLLAGGVAHDLNNVLAGLVTYPDYLLLELDEDSPLREDIEIIKDSGTRAAEIVQDLLSLTRRAVVKKQAIDLDLLVDEYLISPEHQKLLEANPGTKINKKANPNLQPIIGSDTALKKLVMNLVANAAEAQPSGGTITIELSSHKVNDPKHLLQKIDPGTYSILSVSDEGEGIDEENLTKIFEPFYSKKDMGRSGTGLGLTVVWGTVEDHFGAIDVSSTVGKGTILSIYLPATSTSVDISPTEEKQVYLPGEGQSVLIVDDQEQQRKIGSTALSRLGYQVQTCSSGEEALQLLQNQSFDLLILDMVLRGGIDGLDTYKNVVKIRPDQKTIVVSGYSESKQIKSIRKLGVTTCIQKPYTLEELSKAVSEELSTK